MKRNMNWLEDMARPHHRVGQSEPQQLSRVDHAEVGSQFKRLTDMSVYPIITIYRPCLIGCHS